MAVGLLTVVLVAACATTGKRYLLPDRHPETLDKGRPDCLGCHEERDTQVVFANFVHTPDWGRSTHRFQASQNARQVCAMCHEQSFCNECHNTGVELKPSTLRQSDTYRRAPHRGDYIGRHRIDGRLNPASCFRCHGNPKASKSCNPCHG